MDLPISEWYPAILVLCGIIGGAIALAIIDLYYWWNRRK